MKRTFFLSLTTICFTLIYLNHAFAKDKIKKEFNGILSLNISTVSGSCEIIKSSGLNVVVELEYDYEPANTFEPVMNKKNSSLIIKEKMHGSNSGHSTWIIKVPQNMDVKFSTASGNITIKGISGKFDINTASGNITGEEIRLKESSKFSSASGDVKIKLAESLANNISISSASGIASLDANRNHVTGKVVMESRTAHGKIICPVKFDSEKEFMIGNQEYWSKTVKIERETPLIKIHTASGKAILEK